MTVREAHDSVAAGRVRSAWLRLSVALGLVSGLAEAAMRGAQRVWHQFTWVSPQVVWMAPLVNVIALSLLAAILWLAGRKIPGLRSVRVLVAVGTFVPLVAALLSYQPLHPLASVLLAGGFAAQFSRVFVRRVPRLDLRVRQALPWLVGVTAALTLALGPGASVMERLRLRGLPAPPPNAPNVVFLVLDTVRAANLSVGSYTRPTTPNLQRLASQGVYFERAVATSSWTLPSHATLFTGRYASELSADWRSPLDDAFPTLAETFASHGYSTASFVSNLLYLTTETGVARGFAHYDDYRVTLGTIVKTSLLARQIGAGFAVRSEMSLSERRWAGEMNAAFLDWLSDHVRAGHERPFFAFLNYMDAHGPYLPPSPFKERFGAAGPAPSIEARQSWGAQEIEHERNAYDASIASLDQRLGELLGELDRRGLLDRTVVVITSDHGELIGEHNLYDHGNGLHWPLLHVPLLILFPPEVPAGHRVSEPVTLRDLPATILELARIRPATWPGQPLNRLWNPSTENGHAARENGDTGSPALSEISRAINMNPWLPASRGDMKSLVVGWTHYIRNEDGTEELFDLQSDPHEMTNLGTSEGKLRPFRQALATAQRGADDGRDSQ